MQHWEQYCWGWWPHLKKCFWRNSVIFIPLSPFHRKGTMIRKSMEATVFQIFIYYCFYHFIFEIFCEWYCMLPYILYSNDVCKYFDNIITLECHLWLTSSVSNFWTSKLCPGSRLLYCWCAFTASLEFPCCIFIPLVILFKSHPFFLSFISHCNFSFFWEPFRLFPLLFFQGRRLW